jgi:Phage endonuclease I
MTSGVARGSWRGRQDWRNRVEGTEKQVATGLRHGFRSGLEKDNAEHLERHGIAFGFESLKVRYIIPESSHTYSPDFLLLSNGILVETKGKLELDDRKKHMFVKSQWPTLDIRFVFQRPTDRITKTSRTTYGQWATANGFVWGTKMIPVKWAEEPMKNDLPDWLLKEVERLRSNETTNKE